MLVKIIYNHLIKQALILSTAVIAKHHILPQLTVNYKNT